MSTSLFKQGVAAAKAGQREQAAALFSELVRQDPDHELGWLWLASVVPEAQKRACLQQVLRINPDNQVATRELRLLETKRATQTLEMAQVDQSDVETPRTDWTGRIVLIGLVVLVAVGVIGAGVFLLITLNNRITPVKPTAVAAQGSPTLPVPSATFLRTLINTQPATAIATSSTSASNSASTQASSGATLPATSGATATSAAIPPGATPSPQTVAQATVTGNVQTIDVPIAAQPDNQPLRLVRFQLQKTTSSLEGVTVEIRNQTARQQSGFVWYLLAPPNDPEPWNTADYASPEQNIVDLAPNETRTLHFAKPALPLDGDYSVSVWVHIIDPQTNKRQHADGVSYQTPITIRPPFSFTLDQVDAVDMNDGSMSIYVTFSVKNNTATMAEISVSYSIARSSEPNPWENAVFNMPAKTATVAPGEAYTVTYRNTIPLPPGEYQITGWLSQIIDGKAQQQAFFLYPDYIRHNKQ